MPGKPSSLWSLLPLRTGHTLLNPLLLAVPVGFVLHFTSAPPLLTFVVAALGIIPLAAVLGESTEEVATYTGPALGGFLNATLGNATELILGFLLLRAGQEDVVKASLSGSIIGNVLLVLGLSALAGGIGREKQQFSRQLASINSTLLFIAVVALVMPAVFELTVYGRLQVHTRRIEHLSMATAAVLIAIYAASLVFTFITNRPHGATVSAADAAAKQHGLPVSPLISLAIATVLVSFLSDFLVAALQPARAAMGVSDLFMGVIIIAIIGNAAEHGTAVMMARRDRMTLAVSVAIGSSSQIALFVAPVLVFVGWLMGRPMSLVFTPFEIAGIALAVLILQMIASDGETTWFEGAELIAVYLILAVSFYFVPA